MTTKLEGYGLSKDPFPLQPLASVSTWAGRKQERRLLRDIVSSPLSTDIGASEFVIIHGEYGTSKSHALRYFSTLINDRESDKFNAVAIYMPSVKLAQLNHPDLTDRWLRLMRAFEFSAQGSLKENS